MQNEGKFKRDLNRAFTELYPNGWCSFVKSLDRNGTPDLFYQLPAVGLHRVRSGWIEAKVDDNPASAVQLLTIGRMVLSGAVVKLVTLENSSAPKADQRVLVQRISPSRAGGGLGRGQYFSRAAIEAGHFWTEVLAP